MPLVEGVWRRGRRYDSRRDAGATVAPAALRALPVGYCGANARMIQVRHRSYATHSRQPRQVRKEATVTGSCVCSEVPVPGLFVLY
jgi:hypothetical protein